MPKFLKISKMIKLGDYLKKLRKELGLSIREAAKRTKFTPSYLSRIESGNFKSIGIETLVRLSYLYEIPITDFLKESGFLEKSDGDNLPEFPFYLKAKYHLPPQAIRDMEMALEIVKNKYK
ncbi:MAG: helix-turn-helix transcriptional regulator [Patescibacteria group bacterium]